MARARFSSKAARSLAEKALIGSLSPGGARKLDRRLRSSPADHEAFGEFARLFGALDGPSPMTLGQRSRVLGAVLHRTAQDGSRPRPLLRLLPRLAPALALAIMVMGTTLMLLRTPSTPSTMQRRGSAVSAPDESVGLHAVCIRAGQVVKPPARSPGGFDARCRRGDHLQLMVTHTGSHDHLIVLGHLVDDDGNSHLTYYYPVPPTGSSGPAPAGVVEEPLGQAVDLSVNHRPGRLRILGVFSTTPLEAATLFTWARTLREGQRFDELIEHLIRGDHVTAVELRVKIEGEAP